MGWERRHDGRWYLYRNRRVHGRRVKEYLAAEGEWGSLMALELRDRLRLEAAEREQLRGERQATRARADAFVREADAANRFLKVAVEGLLAALGFHRHDRGGWRMKRTDGEEVKPMVTFQLPEAEADVAGVFEQARAGDRGAMNRVAGLLTQRELVNRLGDLAQVATRTLVGTACGNDPVWETALSLKVIALRAELEGANPTVLEQLLVRRVLNGWIAVHALELELAVRTPRDPRARESLEKSLGRAQKRMTSAVTELARVRRLQTPSVLAKLQVNVNAEAPRLGNVTDGT